MAAVQSCHESPVFCGIMLARGAHSPACPVATCCVACEAKAISGLAAEAAGSLGGLTPGRAGGTALGGSAYRYGDVSDSWALLTPVPLLAGWPGAPPE